jgi:hypothetical protein
VDEVGGRKVVAMLNIPLVYGGDMLWSEKWIEGRPGLQEGWRAEQQRVHGIGGGPTGVVEDVNMDDVE